MLSHISSTLSLALLLGLSAANTAAHNSFSYDYPRSYSQWQKAFLSGNGKTGIMVFGDPQHETVIFNSRHFNFPSTSSRSFAKVPRDTVEKISRLCAEGRFPEANSLAVSSSQYKGGGDGGRHPGFALKIDMPDGGKPSEYKRSCDYSTGEISVEWSDANGSWRRRSFVSRDKDVAVFNIASTDGHEVSCTMCLQLSDGANLPSGMTAESHSGHNEIGIHVNYAHPMERRGFDGLVTYNIEGGRSDVRNDTLYINGARNITLIARLDTFSQGNSVIPSIHNYLSELPDDYNTLLKCHTAIHGGIFNRVAIDLGADPACRALPNEALLAMQKVSDKPVTALWERIFDSGRYHYLSSSSELTPPDLLGIWTGDCNAGWGGYYHLDANLNLQIASGNIGAMPEAMEGYFNINEAWADDFEKNARDLLGCRGMVACGNTPGLSSGLMASINEYYPYHYATGEEAWLLYPFWEHYQVTGDTTFLRQRLYPLLAKMGDFYEDFLRHRDTDGRFILTGSVSPENQPGNLSVSLLNNSAFDVAGARWALSTLVRICDILDIECHPGGARHRWNSIYRQLPDYRINADGAISEWGWEGLDEHYDHRHLSHLMMVWPFRETSPQRNPSIYSAARRALAMRDRHNYSNAGHGYLHAALIAAGVHDPSSLADKMANLTRRDFYYTNLATAHYPDHGVFCTDVCHAMPAIMMEMLVGSDEEGICILPALPSGIPTGSISGMRTRCGVTVDKLVWDKNSAKVTLTSLHDRDILLSAMDDEPDTVHLKKGSPTTIELPLNGYR